MTKKEEERINKLYKMGLIYNGQSFIYKDINFHHTDISCMSDQEFIDKYQGAKFRMTSLKAFGPQWRVVEGIERLFFDCFKLEGSSLMLDLGKCVLLQGTNDRNDNLICIYNNNEFYSISGSYDLDSIKLLAENNYFNTIKGLKGVKTYQNGVQNG